MIIGIQFKLSKFEKTPKDNIFATLLAYAACECLNARHILRQMTSHKFAVFK